MRSALPSCELCTWHRASDRRGGHDTSRTEEYPNVQADRYRQQLRQLRQKNRRLEQRAAPAAAAAVDAGMPHVRKAGRDHWLQPAQPQPGGILSLPKFRTVELGPKGKWRFSAEMWKVIVELAGMGLAFEQTGRVAETVLRLLSLGRLSR